MSLSEAVRGASLIRGTDTSQIRTRSEPFGWSYTDLLRDTVSGTERVVDVGTGGGEVFSAVARQGDIALDMSVEKLAVARENLTCSLAAADKFALPLRDEIADVVSDRHVGADPREVLRILRPGGIYLTQQPGERICQSIFDAFGWGTNGDFWRRYFAEAGVPYWNVESSARVFRSAGCEILREEEADVEHEFLDEESLALWLRNAPLPEVVDPDRHRAILDGLSLKTNWHARLLMVRC